MQEKNLGILAVIWAAAVACLMKPQCTWSVALG
ncbi:hypothetical protein SPX_25110 [Sporomusa paucivorans]